MSTFILYTVINLLYCFSSSYYFQYVFLYNNLCLIKYICLPVWKLFYGQKFLHYRVFKGKLAKMEKTVDGGDSVPTTKILRLVKYFAVHKKLAKIKQITDDSRTKKEYFPYFFWIIFTKKDIFAVFFYILTVSLCCQLLLYYFAKFVWIKSCLPFQLWLFVNY